MPNARNSRVARGSGNVFADLGFHDAEERLLKAKLATKIAELIETTARFCIENGRFPDELVPEVVELKALFNQTVELFEKATNPLLTRAAPTGFGRKVSNQGFGRI